MASRYSPNDQTVKRHGRYVWRAYKVIRQPKRNRNIIYLVIRKRSILGNAHCRDCSDRTDGKENDMLDHKATPQGDVAGMREEGEGLWKTRRGRHVPRVEYQLGESQWRRFACYRAR